MMGRKRKHASRLQEAAEGTKSLENFFSGAKKSNKSESLSDLVDVSLSDSSAITAAESNQFVQTSESSAQSQPADSEVPVGSSGYYNDVQEETGKDDVESVGQRHCDKFDIGLWHKRQHSGIAIAAADRYEFIRQCWEPPVDFIFPSHSEVVGAGKKRRKTMRSFQGVWLMRWRWLKYSKSVDGGFCLACMLFAKSRHQLGQLVVSPMKFFTPATTVLSDHETKSYHQQAIKDMDKFIHTIENPDCQEACDVQLLTHHDRQVGDNRQKLCSIVKTILWLGRQNVALRGHRESGTDDLLSSDHNVGNFQALLKFRVEAGDTLLESHLKSCPRNASYCSPRIQNELLSCAGEWVRKMIVADIKKAGMFSVLADEVADCSNQEQLSLVLRFVDSECSSIREEFVGFVHCTDGITGQALATAILSEIEALGLSGVPIRGQGYDGASNMSGKHSGVAKIIQQQHPKAHYVHCGSHALNLCIVAACDVQPIRHMMGVLKELSLYFNTSPKRQAVLRKVNSDQADEDKCSQKKLVDLCKTRWLYRHRAIETFHSLYGVVVTALREISESSSHCWDAENRTRSLGLLSSILSFNFRLAFTVSRQIFQYLEDITTSLQSSGKDIVEAYDEVKVVATQLQKVRDEIEARHVLWMEKAREMGRRVDEDTAPQLPRHAWQTKSDTPAEYFRRNISAPFLDCVIGHLDTRFNHIRDIVNGGMAILPAVAITLSQDEFLSSSDLFHKQYPGDLPHPDSLTAELERWYTRCKELKNSCDLKTPITALASCPKSYPNMKKLLQIMCTLPVTTNSCERSFSKLKLLKTYLRSTMTNDRMTSLALLFVHRQLAESDDMIVAAVVDLFVKRNPRRMALQFSQLMTVNQFE
jgi:hypothetical protein